MTHTSSPKSLRGESEGELRWQAGGGQHVPGWSGSACPAVGARLLSLRPAERMGWNAEASVSMCLLRTSTHQFELAHRASISNLLTHRWGSPTNTQYTPKANFGNGTLLLLLLKKKKKELSVLADAIFLFLLFLGKESRER